MKEVIQSIIQEKIRPGLQEHQGDIELVEVTSDGIVKVRLTGACSSCPGSQQTLSDFVESTLIAECPEVRGVEAITGVSDALIQEALELLRNGRRKQDAK